MRVAIAGAGMSGAYLYRRMKDSGFTELDIYDERKHTACGSRPCAWGFAPTSETRELLSKVLDPVSFEMYRCREVSVDGVKIRSDILTLDKPALLRELTKGATIREGAIDLGSYDRVIDATGVNRAYLPRIKDDVIADCTQYRLSTKEDLGMSFKTSSLGYEWCFPLGNDEYHVGFGNLKLEMQGYRATVLDEGEAKLRCKCHSKVRLSAPFFCQPFTSGNVVGIGESIGAVAPLAGDGNLYAMRTAEMLLEHWDDLEGYSESILRTYGWMKRERRMAEKIADGRMPNLGDALVFKRHSNMVGMEMNTMHIMRLFRKSLER